MRIELRKRDKNRFILNPRWLILEFNWFGLKQKEGSKFFMFYLSLFYHTIFWIRNNNNTWEFN